MLASQMATPRLRPLGVTAGLYVLTLLAACSGAVAPDEWAGQVCAALTPWRDKIEELNGAAQQQVSTADSPAQARTALVVLLVGAESATEDARAAVEKAGTPDVEGGEEIAGRFVAALTGSRDAYAEARREVQALATDDATAFYDAVVAIIGRLTDAYARSAVDTTELDSQRLREAFDGAQQCR
jgi:hypothetical protein